jgi:hypothetical protein
VTALDSARLPLYIKAELYSDALTFGLPRLRLRPNSEASAKPKHFVEDLVAFPPARPPITFPHCLFCDRRASGSNRVRVRGNTLVKSLSDARCVHSQPRCGGLLLGALVYAGTDDGIDGHDIQPL